MDVHAKYVLVGTATNFPNQLPRMPLADMHEGNGKSSTTI